VQHPLSEPLFVNRSECIHNNPAQMNYGAAVVDVDNDQQFEIYVAGHNRPSRVLKWTGEAFTNIADATLSNAGRQAIGVAAGDIDGDGREEIYVLNTDSFSGRKQTGDSLFKWVENRWVDLFTLPENKSVQNLYAGRSVGVVDRLGNGKYGFFVANYGGPMRFYELVEGTLELIDAAPEIGLNIVSNGRAVLPAPMISRSTDIFLNNESGLNYFFCNNGDGTFREVAMEIGLSDPYEHGRGVAVLDVDGDGRLDLVYGNWEGPHRLYVQNKNGHFTDTASGGLATPSRVRTVLAADFDNDGQDEIFFNNILEPNRCFALHNGQWLAGNIGDAVETFGAGTGGVVGDFAGLGAPQILLSHGEQVPQPLTYYAAAANNNAWLRVRPQTKQGAPARGALVRVMANGRLQTKVIDAGSGYLCQMEPVAHFGLGSAETVIAWVEVQWPDGELQRLAPPAPRTELVVRHP
jgi:hypothetical protein